MAAIEGEIDYESLPVNTSWATHMIAGAFAGTMEHCVMYPFDFVKVTFLIIFMLNHTVIPGASVSCLGALQIGLNIIRHSSVIPSSTFQTIT